MDLFLLTHHIVYSKMQKLRCRYKYQRLHYCIQTEENKQKNPLNVKLSFRFVPPHPAQFYQHVLSRHKGAALISHQHSRVTNESVYTTPRSATLVLVVGGDGRHHSWGTTTAFAC